MDDTPTPLPFSDAHIDAACQKLNAAQKEVERVIYGQTDVVQKCLVTLMSGGHALLVGTPGLGKTFLVESIGTVMGLGACRVQFTPDLMPADITGSEILDEDPQGHRRFRFVPGPVFCQLLMADEINRASPRTQSALLQAMQEHQVTVAGVAYDLPAPFHVLATQNPIEQEGTYPLPEAQLDRFMMQVNLSYPDEEAERSMLIATTGAEPVRARAVLGEGELSSIQALVRALPIGEKVVQAIVRLVRQARPEISDHELTRKHVAWGPGSRAAQTLMLATRARALLDGRLSPSIEDVIALAHPVMAHRMALNFGARADGIQLNHVIDALLTRIT